MNTMRRALVLMLLAVFTLRPTRAALAPSASSSVVQAVEVSTGAYTWKPSPANPVPQISTWRRVMAKSIRVCMMVLSGSWIFDLPAPKSQTPSPETR